MKAIRPALFFALAALASALRGQQKQPKTAPDVSEPYETVFISADDEDDRRVPDNAPHNANRDAYAALLNKQDVYHGKPDHAGGHNNNFADANPQAGKRVKGVELTALGIDSVVILPEEMDVSTLDSSMEVDDEREEKLYGEEDYAEQLAELTGRDKDEKRNIFKRNNKDGRRLVGETSQIGTFAPLQCNVLVGLPDAAECDANPDRLMSSLVAGAGSGAVVVPCGECVKYDLPENVTINGLDIQGKLYIPPNYKSTLRTPFVFVQGELQMSDTNPISPDNVSMKIVLTGTTDVTFTPADSNANVTGTPFNAGIKPFLVAGGKLDIRGWDVAEGEERVATWAPVLSTVEGPPPEPTLRAANLAPVPIQPVNTTRTCPRVILKQNFSDPLDITYWHGNDGAIVSHDAENNLMVLSNLYRNWQGFRLDVTKLTLDCPLQEGVDYVITARIMIDKPGFYGMENRCTDTTDGWANCTRWARKIMFKDGSDRWSHKLFRQGAIGKYGHWFTFTTIWRYSAEDLGDNVIGNIFALENNEAFSTISMAEFSFELPSSNSFPEVDNTCSELIVNGNAENLDGYGWSYYPMISNRGGWEPVIAKETQTNGVVNKFIRASNRKYHWDSVKFNMVKGCFVKGMTYFISLRVRVSSVNPVSYVVRLLGYKTDNSGWVDKNPLRCPAQSQSDGWVTCSGPYVVEADWDLVSEDIGFDVILDSKVDTGPVWAVVDYDDISMSFMSGPAEALVVDEQVLTRWEVGTDLHITSSTVSTRDSQNAVIKNITTANGLATIKLKTGIDNVLSEANAPGMGVEVALLSRNIKIEGEANSTAFQGAYFQVLHTPGVAQIIEGVEFTNFGQRQGRNRFSLQFLYSGNVAGTSIARNSIIKSNHRCVVIEGSGNITVEANVAYDTAGHCYYVGREAIDNSLLYNIGSKTNDDIRWPNQLSGESDHDRATFQLYHPQNEYIGNVAAGSLGRGFGVYNDYRTLGEDYVDTGKGSIRRLAMKVFKDNKAHSNEWQGFALYDYEQFLTFRELEKRPSFENVQSFRNRNHGIFGQNLIAAQFLGGIVADNQWGFFLQYSDGVLIDGMTVRGFTDNLKYITTPANRYKICSVQDWTHEGIRMMTRKDRYNELDPRRGLRIKNSVFSDFDKNTDSCPLGSWPIAFSSIITDSHFDYTSSIENVTFMDSRGLYVDACTAVSKYGVDDIVITDMDGSFVEGGYGVLVSNNDRMKFGGDNCFEYPSNCMAYCPGTCLRTVTYAVEQFGTENLQLLVTNANDESISISGKLQQGGDNSFFSDAYRTRKFSVSLSSGSYTAEFINDQGTRVWPTFVEEVWEKAPDCANSATPLDITLLKPQIDVTMECDEFIRKGGQNAVRQTTEPWIHTGPGVQVGSGLGRNNSDAVVTVNRGVSWTGLGQSLNSLCADAFRGRYVELSVWVKMLHKNGTLVTNIDPDTVWWNRRSPQAVLNSRKHRDVSTKEYMYTEEMNDISHLARPYNSAGYNLVHGVFRLPSSTPRIFLEVDSAPDNVELYLDDVSMVPFDCDRDQLVRNGDLELMNITKYWDHWGEPKLDLTLGYGGTGNAVRASARPHLSHGPAQPISLDCGTEAGDRLLFTARIKYESAGTGNQTSCNVYTWDEATRCSDIFMFIRSTSGNGYYNRVGQIVTDDPDADGWYHAHGQLVLAKNQADAEYAKVYFDGTATIRDVIVDNVEVKFAPQQCSQLVLNPSIVDSSFWNNDDRVWSKVDLVPGASGGSDLALRSFERSQSDWRGLRQQLDKRCFFTGAEYEITAKFRLLNGTTSEGVVCDTNVRTNNGAQCPSVVIYGWGCTGSDVYWRFWNSIPNFEWNQTDFNDFNVGFVVDDDLASCATVHVYIHQVNRFWDIVMDDLQITEANTQAPSLMFTYSPTDNNPDATNSPTTHPTSMPTVAAVTNCPDVGANSLAVSAGPIMLGKSSSLCILTKAVDADGTLSSVAPVARSYDGRAWEPSAGEFATQLLQGTEFVDTDAGTQVILPELGPGKQYYLTSYSYSSSHNDTLARLLETATFGTTSADLSAWDKGDVTEETVSEWIHEQIDKPMTSHRAFFRERVNPRLPNPRQIGRSDHPCDTLTRWRKYAFSRKDGELWWFPQYLSTKFDEGDTNVTIKLNGHVRTVVDPGFIAFADTNYIFEFNKDYLMCRSPDERVDGRVYLRMADNSCQWFKNPVIAFVENSDQQPAKVVNLPNIGQSILEPIDAVRSSNGEFIFFDGINDPSCDQLNDISEQDDAPVFGKLPDGSYLQYEPRLKLEDNTIETPIPDGGGLTQALTGRETRCSNAPRTFLNEQDCKLSYSASACGSISAPQLVIELNQTNIATLHNITGQYVYGVLGLPVVDYQGNELESPCTVGLRSRWEIKDAAECTNITTLEAATNATLVTLLTRSSDKNPFIRDITFPTSGYSCGAADTSALAKVEIVVGPTCYKRVHPEHLSVYDFTYWTLENTHPGNMIAMMEGEPNPIKKWSDVLGTVFLTYPAFPSGDVPKHPIERWNTHSVHFGKLGRFGDTVKFVDLPNELRTDEVSEYYGESAAGGAGILVCGSPNEVANDPELGYQFDVVQGQDTEWGLEHQREYIWAMVGLNAEDQLRQRVAWALAQILVVVPSAIGVSDSHTEAFLTYYDIFVRNAFGNYGDILREISYNPLMAENLSFLQSKSAAYMWETQQKISFADENFAREIMQLFSTGLYLLNIDGTPKVDENGLPIPVYTNDEIMSFARIWTGFDYQQARGNVEENSWSGSRHDPMKIEALWRDKFPKSDLLGGYIGDGYPLCVDLPSKMFLRKGATYRLLGASSSPELMEDVSNFKTDPTVKKFVLDAASLLKAQLCNQDSQGFCQFGNSVTLASNLNCTAAECDADTLRVVEVVPGIHYEYVRPPCVEQVFYRNAKKLIYRERWADASCANPLLPYASEACCSTGSLRAYRSPDYLYDQERVTFSTADSRCLAMGKQSCDFNDIGDLTWYKKGYHWSSDGCSIKAKVNAVGQVAIVYDPDDYAYLHPHIDVSNRNFFKVYWDGEYPINDNDVPGTGNSCGNATCQTLSSGCLCDVAVSVSRVFKAMPSSVEEVLSRLTIGAFDPSAYDEGTYVQELNANGVTAYLTVDGVFNKNTVFVVTDSYGRVRRLKNSKEYVTVQGSPDYAFRNAPSFMSILNTEAVVRDAEYETDAALEHYLYHDNTAPFIAYRLIQRFSTSNPNPSYVKAVATAFRSGTYGSFGTGKYGDMSATIAAVLLEPEARSTVLRADPFIGSVKEPLLRTMALMRSMELQQVDGQPVLRLHDMASKIGMMAHQFPTVFSFYLPEYAPDGRPSDATLVSPEAQIMDMPKTVGLLNGMFSLIKYGLSNCNGGFGNNWASCTEGNFLYAHAYLSFSRPFDSAATTQDAHAEAVVSELSTLLTSGRLSTASKQVIKAAYVEKLSSGNADSALRLAQQLIITTPEFHTTNTVKLNGETRSLPSPAQASGAPYKAIVYVMFSGGCDSFNMLVPHTCTGNKDMYAEYASVREEIALKKEDLRVLDGTLTNQTCEIFGVHPRLETVQNMYNDGDLLFFTNTGVLTKETDKQNYWRDTVTQLFAHNWMQRETQRVDPLKGEDGTGVLGRISDALTRKGLSVGSYSIDVNSISLLGSPGVSPPPFILSRGGVSKFNNGASSSTMDVKIGHLNNETSYDSGVFGELWSSKLLKSLSDNKLLYDTLSGKTTTNVFPTSYLGSQLQMVAKMIDTRNERGTDADVFFLQTGGWDTHADVEDNLNNLFQDVDLSFKAFSDELKAKGTWNSVTVIETSDFARTLAPNTGRGSDHAWGGNYMMFGGSVKGRQIVGNYPENLTDEGSLSLGRGRLIPTTSWDAVFLPLAEWAGVGSSELSGVCPNKDNFPSSHFISTDSLFELTTAAPNTNPPTSIPTISPTNIPTTSNPSKSPTKPTTSNPSKSPSLSPSTTSPSKSPSSSPTRLPTKNPSKQPTASTGSPTTSQPTTSAPSSSSPSNSPSTQNPTSQPSTANPTSQPTSSSPSKSPLKSPTRSPTNQPSTSTPTTQAPTRKPTANPSNQPSTANPTSPPTSQPTSNPTPPPTNNPTNQPSTANPTSPPTSQPTSNPTSPPTNNPTNQPSTGSPTVFNPTITKFICAKTQPDDPTICSTGNPVAGTTCESAPLVDCGNGGKRCWTAECTVSTNPPATLSPTGSNPTSCGVTGTSCSTNAQCCSGCNNTGRNPSYTCK